MCLLKKKQEREKEVRWRAEGGLKRKKWGDACVRVYVLREGGGGHSQF